MKTKNIAVMFAIAAAALYAVNIPVSKLMMEHVDPTMMAAMLYLGAGAGMAVYGFIRKAAGKDTAKEPLTKKELPYTVAMVVLDIAAPILLMMGISRTASANVSLQFYAALIIIAASTVLVIKDSVELQHTHEHEHRHTHEHRHGDIIHTHEHVHVHTHIHTHGSDSENHSHDHELNDHDHVHVSYSCL